MQYQIEYLGSLARSKYLHRFITFLLFFPGGQFLESKCDSQTLTKIGVKYISTTLSYYHRQLQPTVHELEKPKVPKFRD